MKKTKIQRLSHIMMVLSLLVFMFGLYVPVVSALENTDEEIVNNVTDTTEQVTNNEETINNDVVNQEEQNSDLNQEVTNNELENNDSNQNVVSAPATRNVPEGKAKIGDTYYATLVDAVAAVTDDTETTIELLVDDLDASGIIIPSGRNITIDFGGHTYNVTGNYAGSNGTKNQSFQLLKNSTIVMRNGIVKNANTSNSMIIQNYANLTLTDMTLDGSENSKVLYALSSNRGNVLIDGSTSMYAADGRVAFDMCWAPNKGYPEGTQMVVDTSGTISGIIELDVWGAWSDNVLSTLEIRNINHVGTLSVDERLADSLTISGGTFTTKPDASYLAEGLVAVGDDTFTIVEGKAKIGSTYFATLVDAVSSLTDDTATTIEVVADDLDASGIIIPSGRNITIDFGGHTYNVTGNYAGSNGTRNQSFQLLKNSTIVMRNGTVKNTGGRVIIQNYANLTLTNMVLDGRNNSNVLYALSSNSGHVLVNGSTSMYVTSGNNAFDMCWAPNKGYPAGTQMVIDTTGVVSGIIELDVWGTFDDNVLSTLEIRNIKHIGTLSVDERLADSLTISGGIFTSSFDDSYLQEGYELVAVNNVYEVQVESGLTGVIQDGDKYIFVTNGEKDTSVNGIVTEKNETYLFKNGVASFTGYKYDNGNRYMLVNGKVDKTYNEVYFVVDKYIYFKNGVMDTTVSGIVNKNDEIYLFKNGIACYSGYKYDSDTGNRYMFENGKVNKDYTAIENINNKYYYFKNGVVDTTVNGIVTEENETYLFKNGVASFTGYKFDNGNRYMFENGKLDKTYNGYLELSTAIIKFSAGVTDTSLNGLALYNDNFYNFKSGVCKPKKVVS